MRPALLAILALAAVLLLWELSDNGWANAYYSGAVDAATHSWTAFWTASLDASRTVSIDKTPLSLWMMALSARVFGFSPIALLVPNALCALGSVGLVYALGRRGFGVGVGLLAALFLALTPVMVAVGRFNNPDSLLVLLLLAAAWWALGTAETGRLRDAALCGVFVGLAFNTKMLQAYLVLPAFAAAVLAAGPLPKRSRLALLATGCLATLLVSGLWLGIMSLTPSASRPWVGDTTADSWWQLAFAANGVGRLSGALGTAGSGAGPLRLLSGSTGGQIAWLLPLALSGIMVGLRQAWAGVARERPSLALWTVWAAVHLVVFSLLLGLFHAYYTSALAPAVALLAAVGAVGMWRGARSSPRFVCLAVAVTIASVALAIVLLRRTPHFLPWLPWALVAAALLSTSAGLMATLRPRSPGWARCAAAGMLVCLLAGPAAYSLATVPRELGGIDPLAGPGPDEGPAWAADQTAGQAALIRYLMANRARAPYLAAVSGALAGAPLALLSRQPVVIMGGFAGSDPAPSPTRLAALVATGQVTSVVLTGRPPTSNGASDAGLGGARRRARWVAAHCQIASLSPLLPTPNGALRARVYRCGSPGRTP